MPIFDTVIKPDAGGSFAHWTTRVAFGSVLPTQRCSGYAHLEADNAAESSLFAAFPGKITVAEPTGFLRPFSEAVEAAASPSTTITLYLQPTTVKIKPEWQALGAAIAQQFSGSIDTALGTDGIGYLIYRNVNVAEAKAALCSKIKTNSRREGGVIDDATWNKFVTSDKGVVVQAGDRIGAAAPTLAGAFQCSVGLRTCYGMFDPGSFYALMTSTAGVTAPARAPALANVFGIRVPLIAGGRSIDAVGNDRIWPWSALLEYKKTNALKYSDWRKLGDLQKKKYLVQLLARVRPVTAPAGTPRFDFDVDDMSNLFQLEAVVEFYLNFQDPWKAATNPVAPPDANYLKINFLSLYGAAATVNGSDVTLDDALDMSRISPGRDTLLLEGEGHRPGKQFRIMDIPAGQKVTVDQPPQIAGASSAWRIFDSPTLVQIDAFGARIQGARAKPGTSTASVVLAELSAQELAAVKKVNIYENISFGSQTEPRGIARIVEKPQVVDADRKATLKLDRDVAVAAGGTAWSIPAGVGGVQGFLAKKPDNTLFGYDQYDGMMFLVAGGEVRCAFPWSSYTSRNRGQRLGPADSSIRGNRHYRFASCFSKKEFINITLSVIDPDGLPRGRRQSATPEPDGRRRVAPIEPIAALTKAYQIGFIQATPPRFSVGGVNAIDGDTLLVSKKTAAAVPNAPSPYWGRVFDGVRESYCYFRKEFNADVASPEETPADKGKGGIRIHRGGYGKNGSEGCQVSPYSTKLRCALVTYHKLANQTYYAENETNSSLDRIRDMYSEKDVPPPYDEHQKNLAKQTALQEKLTHALVDPLALAVTEVLQRGNDDSRLVALRELIVQANLRAAQIPADVGAEDQQLALLAEVTELAMNEDVAGLVEWAAEHQMDIGRLNQELAELSHTIDTETLKWGWDDAMHGDYWLVRPDERAE